MRVLIILIVGITISIINSLSLVKHVDDNSNRFCLNVIHYGDVIVWQSRIDPAKFYYLLDHQSMINCIYNNETYKSHYFIKWKLFDKKPDLIENYLVEKCWKLIENNHLLKCSIEETTNVLVLMKCTSANDICTTSTLNHHSKAKALTTDNDDLSSSSGILQKIRYFFRKLIGSVKRFFRRKNNPRKTSTTEFISTLATTYKTEEVHSTTEINADASLFPLRTEYTDGSTSSATDITTNTANDNEKGGLFDMFNTDTTEEKDMSTEFSHSPSEEDSTLSITTNDYISDGTVTIINESNSESTIFTDDVDNDDEHLTEVKADLKEETTVPRYREDDEEEDYTENSEW
ncbi:unnamed protein product [Didymodactylos carnosus]|uniref:Uncharacterized protein n=1 Tax=Didymodactylos carnosus TaxID=1234261 RepID=A0A816ARP9_9BILA|nr:unnamed protein product [Didymodactylos carnosus]CAF1598383.1 unnamed protein product [Didymodactylos carnosus]CAF3851933.1 unnamed protein product [Didymodactylos carnosus]CAF4474288.1 unnamed protein product [Didymodactylos carnosus]